MELTTLQLAEKIASAVLNAARPRGPEPYRDAPTQAVLKVLYETGTWFYRVTEDEYGICGETPLPGQMQLFADLKAQEGDSSHGAENRGRTRVHHGSEAGAHRDDELDPGRAAPGGSGATS